MALEEIEGIASISKMNLKISTAVSEQRNAAENINTGLHKIRDSSASVLALFRRNLTDNKATAQTAEQLASALERYSS